MSQASLAFYLWKAFSAAATQDLQFTSISTSLLAPRAYLIRFTSIGFHTFAIINGSWINFAKKDDYFSISTLFRSLKDMLHSMVSLSILLRIVFTSVQP
jgi:hypothetical protein